ncbi:MAG: glycogen debranching protein, partial [Planctomycetota bacterium]
AYHAAGLLADGVVEGLRHYGVLSERLRSEEYTGSALSQDSELRQLFNPENLRHLDGEQRALIALGYSKAVDAIRKNITPLGFSACSIPDNEATGTDANYHSVWARDGAVTVVGTCQLDDPDIRACQRQTLVTLLDAMTENGQVPANVRIATGEPDYSGVGGICSIDSGIWLVIAVYHYVMASGDAELLERYHDHLRKIMFWLQAHDSNNDGLLEIPEASDWTDLFGRSYQVLYDEVLWYRANVCWARILEMLEHYDEAVSVFRRSQLIQGKLINAFWPTIGVGREGYHSPTFADRQYSLGDVHYLLAEVTPFNYSWRCDVYGNVLAYLYNVIDAQQARTAFKFMWGVGVNQPWPVSNLYPVVQSGDPDWRPYYTVNLLNLPGHYHNGGIWPLIGGMWVRFIERLGLHDVACQELVRLTELCRSGLRDEWEFNEWYHGVTGRPMGKAYQAWSASSYLHACLELGAGPGDAEGASDSATFCRLAGS